MGRDLGYDLTVAVMATADAFLRESHRLFRPHGLTGAQYNVLNILAGKPGGISQRELESYLWSAAIVLRGLIDAGVNPQARPEAVPLEQFVALANLRKDA